MNGIVMRIRSAFPAVAVFMVVAVLAACGFMPEYVRAESALKATAVNGTSSNASAGNVAVDHESMIRVRPERSWYREGESVAVRISGFPGNRLDWATIVPYGASDGEYREVQYARGRRSTTLEFKPPAPGRHELRVFFDEPGLEDVVLFRFPLWVGSRGDRRPPPDFQRVVTDRHVYEPNSSVEVRYENMPGNAKDWVTIVPADAPRDRYGETMYTEGRNHGNFTFRGFPEGEYEVRAYYDWPFGGYRVQARSGFRVRPAGWDIGRYTRAGSASEDNRTDAAGGNASARSGETAEDRAAEADGVSEEGNETETGEEPDDL